MAVRWISALGPAPARAGPVVKYILGKNRCDIRLMAIISIGIIVFHYLYVSKSISVLL